MRPRADRGRIAPGGGEAMTDIHTHLLPGIDDGPESWEESLALCALLVADGITTAVATPHVIDEVYHNTPESIAAGVAELNRRLAEAQTPLQVLAGGEVHMTCARLTLPPDSRAQGGPPCSVQAGSSRGIQAGSSRGIQAGSSRTLDIPTLNGSRYLLLELPSAVMPPSVPALVFALTSRGSIPIIAHPERIHALQEHPELGEQWLATGCYFQIDAESVLGLWGGAAATCARHLIEAGLAHALASDAHSCRKRPPRMRDATATIADWVGSDMVDYLVNHGPDRLVSDRPPGEPPPRTVSGRRTWRQRLARVIHGSP
jgi:protein-tyrosine phosphatase